MQYTGGLIAIQHTRHTQTVQYVEMWKCLCYLLFDSSIFFFGSFFVRFDVVVVVLVLFSLHNAKWQTKIKTKWTFKE